MRTTMFAKSVHLPLYLAIRLILTATAFTLQYNQKATLESWMS